MYTNINFKTKKEFKQAISEGKVVTLYQPGPFGNEPPQNGSHAVEGPHAPQPHRWYATAVLEDGRVVQVK